MGAVRRAGWVTRTVSFSPGLLRVLSLTHISSVQSQADKPKKRRVPPPEEEELFDSEKELVDLRDRLAPWQWTAFNSALDVWHKCNHSRRSAVWYRISGLRLSLNFAKTYPPRPTEPLPSSPAVDKLRAVLAQAPSLPEHGSEEYGQEIEGLSRTGGPPHAWYYDWSNDYLQRLFSALNDVIRVGKAERDFDKWRAIRWEVYDKVRLHPIVIVCMLRALMGGLPVSDSSSSARTRARHFIGGRRGGRIPRRSGWKAGCQRPRWH